MALKPVYGSATAITITLTSLSGTAGSNARQSDEISNTTNRYLDALVRLTANGSAAGNDDDLVIAAFSSVATGARTGGAGASDAAFTPARIAELKVLGAIKMQGTTAVTGMFSVAEAFGGVMPEKWGIVVLNESGAALSATAGDFDVDYQGVHFENA